MSFYLKDALEVARVIRDNKFDRKFVIDDRDNTPKDVKRVLILQCIYDYYAVTELVTETESVSEYQSLNAAYIGRDGNVHMGKLTFSGKFYPNRSNYIKEFNAESYKSKIIGYIDIIPD